MYVAAGMAAPNLGIVGWPLVPLGSFGLCLFCG